jgi:nucleoid DNA-binding protein
LNKLDLAYEWGDRQGWNRSYSVSAIDNLLKLITEALIDGEEVRLSGIGVLYTKNPSDDKRKLEFRESFKFKELLENNPVE